MNHSFVATSEHQFALKTMVGMVLICFGMVAAKAAPMGGAVVAGSAIIAGTPTAVVVNQSSGSAVINWQSFGIGVGESVQFVQPGSNSVALNRVTGLSPTAILGQLSANGKVFVVNPNGVLFGSTASVNVGGLVASTLSINNDDFMNGEYQFTEAGSGHVVNQGNITTTEGGYVAMIGPRVVNNGTIIAPMGTVAMVAANAATLDISGDQLINAVIDEAVINALVENTSAIRADGGLVILSTQAANSVLDNAVNNTGVIQARSLDNKAGTIRLLAGTESGSTVVLNGTLDASALGDSDPGLIETSANQLIVTSNSVVTTMGNNETNTGLWLLQTQSYLLASADGNETGNQVSESLGKNNRQIVARENIAVNDEVNWNSPQSLSLQAGNTITINQEISAANSSVFLIADADGTGPGVEGGTVEFGPNGLIEAASTTLRSNPDGYINTSEEIADYSNFIQGPLDAKAWLFVKADTKVFDGTTQATLSLKANPNDDGEGDIALVGNDAAFTNPNVGIAKPATYTGYSTEGTNTTRFELFSGDTGIAFGEITVASLEIIANDQTKRFGDRFIFNGTEFTSNGLKNGETIGLVTLTSTGAPASASVAGSPYPIVPSDARGGTFTASNYTITYVNGQLTITQAPLVIRANDQTKVVGNTFTFTGNEFTATGLKSGNSISTVSLSSAGAPTAATVAGSPYAIAISDAMGAFDPANYTISYVNGLMTVIPVPVIVDPPVVVDPPVIVDPPIVVVPPVIVNPPVVDTEVVENPDLDIPPFLDASVPTLVDPGGLIAITPFGQQSQMIVAEKEVPEEEEELIPETGEAVLPEMPPKKQDRN